MLTIFIGLDVMRGIFLRFSGYFCLTFRRSFQSNHLTSTKIIIRKTRLVDGVSAENVVRKRFQVNDTEMKRGGQIAHLETVKEVKRKIAVLQL